MRTTLTLDSDVAMLVKRRIKERGVPLKSVINEALRKGLRQTGRTSVPVFRVEPHSFKFKPGIDLNKLNQLVDELEVDEYRRKFTR